MATYEVEKITANIIGELYNHGNLNKGVLASIRDSATLVGPRAQAAWPVMMMYLTPQMLSKTGQPTLAETAIYTAMRLYAIHQQSKDQLVYGSAFDSNKELKGKSLFVALAELRQDDDTRVALDRRVQQLLGTTNVNSIITGITHLVGMLKANNWAQKIDYAQLAQDFHSLQAGYDQANRVRLRWGQAYFRPVATTKSEGKKN
ncbi:type I-E CRISPR-associated protein Cse2/CasB [Levilactobacillus suantsaii]|uniref:type I-E CRISPR-associated protein Cse2/CasB n=1 Tax=Levilactobacillus suantsaii TaxID=2292255 RepID=UPI0015F63303|nr:type I-E CRISPR-associated protein Cse2/CasB [Levilactobacillus suantsaii]QMU08780.1 type I-E CRISPR-associated protein Cse2/CasB [Levilactobacillus suantsaii]